MQIHLNAIEIQGARINPAGFVVVDTNLGALFIDQIEAPKLRAMLDELIAYEPPTDGAHACVLCDEDHSDDDTQLSSSDSIREALAEMTHHDQVG